MFILKQKWGTFFQKNKSKQSMTASFDFCCPMKHENNLPEFKLQPDSSLSNLFCSRGPSKTNYLTLFLPF